MDSLSNPMGQAIESLATLGRTTENRPLSPRRLALGMLPILLGPLLQWVAAQPPAGNEAEGFFQKIRSSVVLVRVQKQMSLSESSESVRQVLFNGALVDTRFRPNIIKVVQSNGVAYDNSGHVASYVGYRWLSLNPRDPGVRIDLVRYDGFTVPARLVGVDQRAGVVILQAPAELPLRPSASVPPPEKKYPQGLQKQSFYLVDLDSQEVVRKATLNHVVEQEGFFKGTSKLLFAGKERISQGQLVFEREGNFLGFVYGSEPGIGSDEPDGILTAQRALVSADKIVASNQDIPAGWLGLYIEAPPPGTRNRRITVRNIVPGSPAEVSGIRSGDQLLRIEGTEIVDPGEFLRIVRWSEIGRRLQIQTQRGNSQSVLAVQVAPRMDVPAAAQSTLYLQFAAGTPDSAAPQIELSEVQGVNRAEGEVTELVAPPRLGIIGDDLTPQLGNYFGVEGGRGVLIISVGPGSLADRHGMRAGDVIVKLNEDPVGNQLSFLRILERHAGDPGWNIRLMRERKPVEVRIKLRPNPDGK